MMSILRTTLTILNTNLTIIMTILTILMTFLNILVTILKRLMILLTIQVTVLPILLTIFTFLTILTNSLEDPGDYTDHPENFVIKNFQPYFVFGGFYQWSITDLCFGLSVSAIPPPPPNPGI